MFLYEAEGIRTLNHRIDSPVLNSPTTLGNSSSHNSLGHIGDSVELPSAAESGAVDASLVESWLLYCPVFLSLDQRRHVLSALGL